MGKEVLTRVGCAGWSIPKEYRYAYPPDGSQLQHYAQRFPAVEINITFYRLPRPATFARWAQETPDSFLFAVKLPRQITHQGRLKDLSLLDEFLERVGFLGEKLGPALVQLPPGLAFDPAVAERFFAAIENRFNGYLACEPRHPSWFTEDAKRLMLDFRVALVDADPPPVPGAEKPGGWSGLIYRRLHGSPRQYYSSYPEPYLQALARKLTSAVPQAGTWCIFNNTASGAATRNALDLLSFLSSY